MLSSKPIPRIESSLRRICFNLTNPVTPEAAKAVGPGTFRRYEHALYIGAQLSRIVYCDTGIMWNVIEKSFGMSNDVVNKVITAYDAKFANTRRTAISSQAGDGAGRPMESYSLKVATPGDTKYGTYISTPGDMTCLFLNAGKIKENTYSIFQPRDVFITFKGSSTLKNFKHDLMSQFTPSDLGSLLAPIGIKVEGDGNKVTGAFVTPMVNAWSALNQALEDHVKEGSRLFLCGHSLGGAYCTLFGFILAEGKASGTLPIMSKVDSIHILSYGAPTLLGDKARNTFNRHLDSGLLTVDRVVSQKVPARSAATQLAVAVGGLIGPNDVVPNIPVGFAHPGFRPLATEVGPEAGGRPYSIDNIRKFYGVNTDTRYRDPSTWPFEEDVGLGDRANATKLQELVKRVTGGLVAPAEEPPAPSPAELAIVPAGAPTPPVEGSMEGGALFQPEKTKYETDTKTHIPNFVSVQGSVYMYGFAHGEYLGMFFMGGFRLAGMKNPSSSETGLAFFTLYPSGVKISYGVPVPLKIGLQSKISNIIPTKYTPSTVNSERNSARNGLTAENRKAGWYKRDGVLKKGNPLDPDETKPNYTRVATRRRRRTNRKTHRRRH
jgi:hypothetical protein